VPATVLPLREIRERLADGETPKEIQDDLRTRGLAVPLRTVQSIMHRAGIRRRSPVPWPWTVEARHQYLYPLTMLRFLRRRDGEGKPLSPEQLAELTRWLNRLDSDDVVLDYVPDRTPPFIYARRRYMASGEPVDVGMYRDRTRLSCGCNIDACSHDRDIPKG